MTLRTTVKTFNFDISTEAGRKGWEALKKEQCENKSALFSALGTYYFPELEGKTVELETKHLFSNQWNSACGKRLFDFACDVLLGKASNRARQAIHISDAQRRKRARLP
jgi:hypothetical protein